MRFLPLATLGTAAAAAALLAAPAPALAAANASGTISDFSYTLIDLNPGDGIDPWVTWSSEYQYVGANAGAGDYDGSNDLGAALSVSDASAGRSAWASTDGLGSGSAGADSTSAPGSSSSSYANPISASFELSPWTAIVLNAHFEGQAQTTVGYDGATSEYASAYGYLGFQVWVDDGWESHYASRQAWAGALWDGQQYTGMSDAFDGAFSVNFANLSDATANGYAYAQAYAQAFGLPPVPEPATWALMLAGLAGVGGLAWRRERRHLG